MATHFRPRVHATRNDSPSDHLGVADAARYASPAIGVTMPARTWVLSSEIQHIGPVVDDIVGMCREAGFSAKQCRLNVPVAITEALANAMLRGNENLSFRQVIVVAEVTTERLVVDVTDEGQGFDLECAERTPDNVDWLEREDGRGVFLMRQLMDRVENRCIDSGHLLRLTLHRA